MSQSQSAWERRGQDERAGGWLSGDTEAEIHEDSETDSKTARGDTHTPTHTHTHTHLSVVFGNTCVRSCWVEPNFNTTHGLRPIRLLCPWHFPGEDTGSGLPFPSPAGSSRPRDQTPVSCARMPCHLNQDIANSLGKIQRIELVFY